MSIIYKALQKTQKNREKEKSAIHPRSERDPIFIGLIILIGILLSAAIYVYLPTWISYSEAKKTVQLQAQQKIDENVFKAKYVLNGIFISDNTKLAMINSQYYHIGDQLESMRIILITQNEVRLANQNQTIVLQAPL